MSFKNSYWNYVPIVFVLALGYIVGGVLTFGVEFLDYFSEINDQLARDTLIIFGMGLLGGVTRSTHYWAIDINEVVYKKPKYGPHFFDFFGYASMVLEGGITGIVAYLIVKSGLVVITFEPQSIEINRQVALLIAYCGGLFHFEVISKLKKVTKDLLSRSERDEHSKK